jgi:DNA-binding response OmpR family regulator
MLRTTRAVGKTLPNDRPDASLRRGSRHARNGPSTSYCVLIAENNALVGFDIGDELERHGYTIAGPFSSCAAASEWLVRNAPDVTILAVHLSDGACTELARQLRAREIPFLIYSGEEKRAHPELGETTWLTKPALPKVLLDAVAALVAAPRRRRG